MEDYATTDDDYYEDYDDDRDSLGGFELDSGIVEAATRPSTKVITKESLLAEQWEHIDRVMELLSLKEHQARTLLIYYRWDVNKVIQLFVEDGKDKLYTEAGVAIVYQEDLVTAQLPSLVDCNICFDEAYASEVTVMDCGHFFCNNCWTQHFIVRINEGQSRRIRCMESNCNAICDDAKIRNLVAASNPDLAEKFDQFLLESYIEDNKRVKWCPSVPHCGNAIQIEDDEPFEVVCACGKQFCFSCLSEAHSPCSCIMWEHWSKKCQDASETNNWITVHTKPCPKCRKPVEKNGGCNLVCCLCGQAFCWLCGGATGRDHTYTTIAYHSCGRFKEEYINKAKRAERDLKRYMHYYKRYRAHLDSLKLESKMEETIKGKILALEARESASKDFSWIRNALHILLRSRRILSATYVFAFFMFGDDLVKDEMTDKEKELKKNLFENQQQQFEGNVEKLSSFLVEKFHQYDEEKVLDLRMRIIAVSVSTDNLCRNMYECIENDLLGCLKGTFHSIAPYKSRGVLRSC
ncbi:probable E3 ubiquitin-protein ligase ARI2 [Euphorbia lathyris]|uniref:probable E3 ubiquitin-protein ligase ARI2 n=1 Tax=Euphorbia lathyris TaxID=212925 RepID=UPI0033133369